MLRTFASLAVAAGAAFAVLAAPAAAQTFPSKPIEIVVPFAAGGSTDVMSRLLATRLSDRLKQPVIVVNRPGGGSTIGTAQVAKAAPDGHTLLAQTIAFAINAAARAKLPYDPIKDFAPVVEVSTIPLMVLVHPSLPVNSIQELIALAKKQELNYASSGFGTSPHLAGEMFNSMAGVKLTHIPYKGNAEASAALLSGQVPIHFGLVPPFIGHVKSGALRVIAVTTEKRIDTLPDTPTVAEAGFPDFEISSWQGYLAPGGTPKEIVEKLNAELVRLINSPEIRDSIVKQGAAPVAGTAEAFTKKVASEIAKWKMVIEKSGAKME
jgi:tripartite-type tricarboxylate transporter receptor subunit TctC